MVKRELLVLHFPLQWAREYVRHTVGIEMLLLPYRAQVWGGRSLCVTTHRQRSDEVMRQRGLDPALSQDPCWPLVRTLVRFGSGVC